MADPERLGKYEIRRPLGAGAVGTVYEAFDPDIRRLVAIKTVRMTDTSGQEVADVAARVRREAEAAGRLSHPNVVGIYDYGTEDELIYIVMELVQGETLKTHLDRQLPVPLSEAMGIMQDLLAGLHYSHSQGVVHRDIKPANIMLTREGRAKIADFGIARIEDSTLTRTGTIMGTPAYMSPEQINGETADARSDVYSAGVVLYHLLTGERPFEGSSSAMMQKILLTPPILPSQIRLTCPRSFDDVVRRALEKRPEDRFQSAAAFANALRAAAANAGPTGDSSDLATVVMSPRPVAPSPEAAPATGKKSRSLATIGAVVAVALLVGAGAGFLFRGQAPPVSTPSVEPIPQPQTPSTTTNLVRPPRPAPTLASPGVPALPAPVANLPPPLLPRVTSSTPAIAPPPASSLASSPLPVLAPPASASTTPLPPIPTPVLPQPPKVPPPAHPPPATPAEGTRPPALATERCKFPHFSGMTTAAGAAAIIQMTNNQLPCTIRLQAGANRPFDSLTLTEPPKHGTVTIAGSSFSYKPTAGFEGQDTFKIESTPSGRLLGRVTVTLPR